ncbi:MAG: dTMP kinase [bacterium]|nr:dTMP kinase [bacterium]
MKGKFITFEGPEGSGKSTQMEMLHSYLLKKGYDCIKTHEPGGTGVGEMIRKIVLACPVRPHDGLSGTMPSSAGGAPLREAARGARDQNIADRAELLLMLADRAQHTAEVILPGLNAGKIVLCDRYNDSTVAYQGYGRGLDLEEVRRLCEYASLRLQPDLTFLLDVEVATGLSRSEGRRKSAGKQEVDRFESAGRSFHEKVRAGYLSLAKDNPNRIVVLGPSQDIAQVHAQIVRLTESLLCKP